MATSWLPVVVVVVVVGNDVGNVVWTKWRGQCCADQQRILICRRKRAAIHYCCWMFELADENRGRGRGRGRNVSIEAHCVIVMLILMASWRASVASITRTLIGHVRRSIGTLCDIFTHSLIHPFTQLVSTRHIKCRQTMTLIIAGMCMCVCDDLSSNANQQFDSGHTHSLCVCVEVTPMTYIPTDAAMQRRNNNMSIKSEPTTTAATAHN